MIVDKKGFDRKMLRMQGELIKLMQNLLRDAAAFLQGRIVDEVINGETGEGPKNYPGGISKNATGFVGVDSGNLRRSIQSRKESDTEWLIFQQEVVAPYGQYVNTWAEKKYGKGFLDIALELHSQAALQFFTNEIARFVGAVSENKNFNYKNPFI